MTAPIIFIHCGDSSYLRCTLQAAVLFNSDKRVILLGDRTNAHHRDIGIEHVNFTDYAAGREIELFDRIYRHTAGEQHGRREWTRFVFRRWFIIHNYLQAHDLHRFWTFDSDTLILTRLAAQEPKFLDYDCTEQCSGCCLNGLITARHIVSGYVNKINELFQNEVFLENQRRGFQRFPRYAFTEMRAYMAYRDESHIRCTRLSAIIGGETFLDSVCTLGEHTILLCDDEYDTYCEPIWEHRLKKIYLADDGTILMFHMPSRQFVKLNTINLSWVPDRLFDVLLDHVKRGAVASSQRGFGKRREALLLSADRLRALQVETPAMPRRLPITEKLLRKIRALRGSDGNFYPLF